MKKITMLTLVLACVTATCFAAEPKFGLDATWHSKNMSKGLIMMDKPWIEYNGKVAWEGFSATITMKQDLTSFNGPESKLGAKYNHSMRYRIKELDYVLAYSKSFDFGWVSPISLGASYEHDQYPNLPGANNSWKDATYALTIGLDNVLDKTGAASLGFVFKACYDAVGDNAWRGEMAANYGYKLSDKISVGANLTAFWRSGKSNGLVYYNEGYQYRYISGDSVNTIMLKPSISYAVTDNMTISAYAAVATAANEKARKAQENGPMNSTFNYDAGVGVSYKF